ncbi:MAG: AMP-binding protein [Planctomycetes bacterium]|nr:AMP-binding protein [Planctomycetota bacterium]MCP4769920.1 AMP-binding protein [Planctomycetota bacterium]MCP4859760.1 AMP-binding protein [Planctomycetota bacterium]
MKSSYVKGGDSPSLLERTIGQAFDLTVQKWPQREALVSCQENIHWTWTELAQRVNDFAKGLLELGIGPGDRTGIWATNKADWTVAQIATSKIGSILVNINPAYRPHELEYVLNKVGVKCLVTGSSFKSSNYTSMLQELLPELNTCMPRDLRAEKAPDLRLVIRLGSEITPGMVNFNTVVGSGKQLSDDLLVEVENGLNCYDPINIQFTSGTTGSPKGATLTHYNVLNNSNIIASNLNFTEEDRICVSVPLYHCFGMVAGNLAAINRGATMVYPAEVFDPETVLQAIDYQKCTAMYGVPTMFLAAIEHPDFPKYDMNTLRTGIMAGAPCPRELMRKAVSEMHLPQVTIGYGMTETSPISFQGHTYDSLEERVGTVGQVCPHTETKIIDADGNTAPCGVQGEILTRGYLVMKGYWNDEEKTKETINEDGWIHTGDLGVLDEKGWLKITGRLKDMVIRGGENVYPREIEEYLYTHPNISEVQVFGVPDEKFGEEIAAWIRLHEGEALTEDDVRAFCKGEIAYYKIPRYIRFVEDFPMTVTGKIQKFEMRKVMVEELGDPASV